MLPSVPEEVLVDLADRYGVSVASLHRLGGHGPSSDGVRYQLPGEPPRIMKVMATATADLAGRLAIAERVTLSATLATEGAPIPTIRASRRGQLLETIDHGPTSYAAYAMVRIPGRPLLRLPREARTPYLSTLGRTLARVHLASRGLHAWRTSPTIVDGRPILSWQAEWTHVADACQEHAVLAVWQGVRAELEALPTDRDSFGFVHNDPHLHNVLVDGDRLAVVDLDVATYHWFAADLAAAVLSITGEGRYHDALAREQVARLLDGYLAVDPAAEVWLTTLPLFLAYRRALLFIALRDVLPRDTREAWRKAVVGREPVLDWTWSPPAEPHGRLVS